MMVGRLMRSRVLTSYAVGALRDTHTDTDTDTDILFIISVTHPFATGKKWDGRYSTVKIHF